MPNFPDFDVLTPTGEGERTRWTKVGAGWQMQAADGRAPFISITLDALPLNGRLIIVEADTHDHQDKKRRAARKAKP